MTISQLMVALSYKNKLIISKIISIHTVQKSHSISEFRITEIRIFSERWITKQYVWQVTQFNNKTCQQNIQQRTFHSRICARVNLAKYRGTRQMCYLMPRSQTCDWCMKVEQFTQMYSHISFFCKANNMVQNLQTLIDLGFRNTQGGCQPDCALPTTE